MGTGAVVLNLGFSNRGTSCCDHTLQVLGLPAAAPAADAGTCGAPAQTTRDRPQPAEDAAVAAVAAEAAAAFGAGSEDFRAEDEWQDDEDRDGVAAAADGAAWEVLLASAAAFVPLQTLHSQMTVGGCTSCMFVLGAVTLPTVRRSASVVNLAGGVYMSTCIQSKLGINSFWLTPENGFARACSCK